MDWWWNNFEVSLNGIRQECFVHVKKNVFVRPCHARLHVPMSAWHGERSGAGHSYGRADYRQECRRTRRTAGLASGSIDILLRQVGCGRQEQDPTAICVEQE